MSGQSNLPSPGGILTKIGMRERVNGDTELHFLPAINSGVYRLSL